MEELGECCWVISFIVFNALVQGVELLTSPWYLLVFVFTKSSMPCLSSLASSSNLEMRKRHGKRGVWREINHKRKCERERTREWELQRQKGNKRKSVTKEKHEGMIERDGRSKKNEEMKSEWEGDATLTIVSTLSFTQPLDETIFLFWLSVFS